MRGNPQRLASRALTAVPPEEMRNGMASTNVPGHGCRERKRVSRTPTAAG